MTIHIVKSRCKNKITVRDRDGTMHCRKFPKKSRVIYRQDNCEEIKRENEILRMELSNKQNDNEKIQKLNKCEENKKEIEEKNKDLENTIMKINKDLNVEKKECEITTKELQDKIVKINKDLNDEKKECEITTKELQDKIQKYEEQINGRQPVLDRLSQQMMESNTDMSKIKKELDDCRETIKKQIQLDQQISQNKIKIEELEKKESKNIIENTENVRRINELEKINRDLNNNINAITGKKTIFSDIHKGITIEDYIFCLNLYDIILNDIEDSSKNNELNKLINEYEKDHVNKIFINEHKIKIEKIMEKINKYIENNKKLTNQINEYNNQILSLQDNMKIIVNENNDYDINLKKCNQKLEEQVNEFNKKSKETIESWEKKMEIERKLNDEKIKIIEVEKTRIQTELNELKIVMDKNKGECDKCIDDINKKTSEIEKLKNEINQKIEYQKVIDNNQNDITICKTKLEMEQNEMKALNDLKINEIETLKSNIEIIKKERDNLTNTYKEHNDEIENNYILLEKELKHQQDLLKQCNLDLIKQQELFKIREPDLEIINKKMMELSVENNKLKENSDININILHKLDELLQLDSKDLINSFIINETLFNDSNKPYFHSIVNKIKSLLLSYIDKINELNALKIEKNNFENILNDKEKIVSKLQNDYKTKCDKDIDNLKNQVKELKETAKLQKNEITNCRTRTAKLQQMYMGNLEKGLPAIRESSSSSLTSGSIGSLSSVKDK